MDALRERNMCFRGPGAFSHADEATTGESARATSDHVCGFQQPEPLDMPIMLVVKKSLM